MFNEKKFDKLFELMKEKKLDAVMIAPSSDMEFLVDYHAHADERLNCLVVLSDKRYFQISPLLNYEEAKVKYPEDAVFYKWADGEGFLDTVKKSFEDFGLIGGRIGVNETIRGIDVLDFQELLEATFVNAHPMMEAFRIVKSNEEIQNMKKAGQIADEVMRDIKNFIKPGLYEYEVIEEIKRLYKEKGADDISFSPIVATGKNSSMPHYNAGTSKIQVGDNVVVDCGCRFNNMCSDTSRTFFVGEPSEEQRRVYEICKRSTFTAQDAALSGVTAGSIDKVARDIIDGEGYRDCFLNRTGHGIGFSVHEAPYIKPNNELVLEEGMAFSIEPGIYIAGKFGMRVENIVVIENGKGVSMNHSPVDIEDVIIKL
ncbi:aminopeptidase P family protein [Acidaminobacter sp. JC074]|uniref:M24 family metallopeptidase n=1 Tax=Acidaminobacter sp. JC074 TaxID=2530199 RepID=UPI001F0F0A56|nr:Xaa-Pro peptidase family protein [Acidaminobacter sp. JC074]MCH4888473.1 aminopeptidase P family protein [Acidaminobacter sp. JC074]